MSRVKINFIAPTKGYGFHITPTIYCWTSDFTGVELRDVMGFKSYGVSIKIFNWQMGLSVNVKPKTYNDNK